VTDTPPPPARYVPPPDPVLAWSNAANCRLYEDDPGPAPYRDGSAAEGRMISRADAWRDCYARSLLYDLDADPDRLTAALGAVNNRIRRSHRPGFWLALAWRRFGHPGWRRAGRSCPCWTDPNPPPNAPCGNAPPSYARGRWLSFVTPEPTSTLSSDNGSLPEQRITCGWPHSAGTSPR
jgi:hypothetical protein